MKKLKLIVCLVFWAFWANAQSVTYYVTNGNASGAGSFQEAVDQMNALSSPHQVTINFSSTFFGFSNIPLLQIDASKINSLTIYGFQNYFIIEFFNYFPSFALISLHQSIVYIKSLYTLNEFPSLEIHENSEVRNFDFMGSTFFLNNVLIHNSKFNATHFIIKNNLSCINSEIEVNNTYNLIVEGDAFFDNSFLYFSNVNLHIWGNILITNCFIGVNSQFQNQYDNSNSYIFGISSGYLSFTIINSYFLGDYEYGISNSSFSELLLLSACNFGHPNYSSLGSPKKAIYNEGRILLRNNKFYNSETAIHSSSNQLHLDTTNQMFNCKNGIVIPNYTNSIAITSVDTAANTIGGTCNCNEVMVWKNGSPLSSNKPTGESFIATVPCTSGNWSFTNTSSTPITQLTFMERFNISNSFLGNKRTGTFTNWQGFDLGTDITKCASTGKVLNANIFGSSNHVWNTGANSPTITAYNEGLYKVTFLDLLGNERSDSIFISNDTNIRQVDIGLDSTICNGDSVRLVSNVLSGVSYLWNNGKTTSAIYVKTQGWHKLTIKDSCNNISADSIFLTVNQNCGKILGRVFYDADSSCTFNGIDKAYRNILVKANPGNYYTFTDANGNYQFLVPANDYRVEIVTGTDWRVKCPSDTVYNITLPANTIINNRNFSILPIKGSPDLEVHFTNSLMRPLSAGSYHISYKNTGKLGSGNVKFTLPDSVNFGSSSPAASAVSGKTYTYNFTNLFPGETRFITINGNVITNTIGTPLASCAEINPIATDYDSTNNRICKTEIVRGAIDPNDKLVTPTGVSQYGYIERKDSVLTYTIRFQNIGTDTAFNVLITDTLSNQVNFESIRVLEASHSYYMQQTQGGVLRFRFKNIKLPDSTTNQVKSNGFISFRVKLKPNLAHGTEIKNIATIYFDTQAGLATNEVQNTIMHYLPMVNEGNLTKCYNDSVQLSSSVAGGSYLWNTGDTTQQIWVYNTGNYHYQFTDSLGFMAVSNVVEISHYPISELTLSTNGDTLFATEGFAYYTWYLDGEILTTTTAQNYIIPQIDGDYMVQITENQGACSERPKGCQPEPVEG
jgi:uncharacterized repeat protein (TIGR01451 family)